MKVKITNDSHLYKFVFILNNILENIMNNVISRDSKVVTEIHYC